MSKNKLTSARRRGYPRTQVRKLRSLGNEAALRSFLRRGKGTAKRPTSAILRSPSFRARLDRAGVEAVDEIANAAVDAVRVFGKPESEWSATERREAIDWMAHRLRGRIAELSRGRGRPRTRGTRIGLIAGAIANPERLKPYADRRRLKALERRLPELVHAAAVGLWHKERGGTPDYASAMEAYRRARLQGELPAEHRRVRKAIALLLKHQNLSANYASRLLKKYQRKNW